MSSIQIEIVDVVVEKINSYKKMTVTHKTMYQGQQKIDAKAIMDFATPPDVWETLLASKKGDQFTIDREKDKKDGKYWVWIGIHRQDGHPMPETPTVEKKPSFGELDARKQRYIIRQSSLGHAVHFVGVRDKTADQVLEIAEKFASWVLEE